jgi:hypothetical protein
MRTLKLALVVLGLVGFVSVNSARADEGYMWEWTGASTASFNHTWTGTGGGADSNLWNLGFGANYFLSPAWEIGLTGAFNEASSGGVSTRMAQLLVGPTYNFMGNAANSCFVQAQVGFNFYGDGPVLPNFTTFGWNAGIGKRMEIATHVTWKPEIELNGNLKNTDSNTGFVKASSTQLAIVPFQFSVLW